MVYVLWRIGWKYLAIGARSSICIPELHQVTVAVGDILVSSAYARVLSVRLCVRVEKHSAGLGARGGREENI